MMRLDGKAIATDLLESVRRRIASLGRVPVVRAVVVNPTPATQSYLRIKAARAADVHMRLELVRLPDDVSNEDVKRAVLAPGADAVIVQLPLPPSIDASAVLDAIPLDHDADVLSSLAYERFSSSQSDALTPPVACAVAELLAQAGVSPIGQSAVVIGDGRLVGKPVRAWLACAGADVNSITEETFQEKRPLLKNANIVVAGAGTPHLITPDLLKEGAVLIDAGTSELGGAIVGDFHPTCADIASVFTPVPGGVGPVAVACLFRNVADLLSAR